MSIVAELLEQLAAQARAKRPDRIPLIGVAGAQGAGKSFQCRLYAEARRGRVAHFSMDDVYLPRAARERMAREAHPLFITRGPPGTHDLALAQRVIESLRAGKPTALPRFDKARDDRVPESEWMVFEGPAEAIVIDGWCLGATAPPVSKPINELEAKDDSEGLWRARVGAEIVGPYAVFFSQFDAKIYLQPPSFEIVSQWRAQQEAENLGRPLTAEDQARLARFIQHYERITRAMLAGAHGADWIVRQDETRAFAAPQARDAAAKRS